ncbi:hypothetical protein R69776_06967 [Paraburkholderia nemoris]|uniref:Secreted protein n=1 Tax=Paraburkholderia nemoris TaxID=2793076 RepID=A0ABM8SX17_9BURK|nr:hypothetical protein R75777_01241 [Paraburkholderia nemoris]CAE6839425.1 hypothetical protein R69776_06967 [Paraburkholderia nemoris]
MRASHAMNIDSVGGTSGKRRRRLLPSLVLLYVRASAISTDSAQPPLNQWRNASLALQQEGCLCWLSSPSLAPVGHL